MPVRLPTVGRVSWRTLALVLLLAASAARAQGPSRAPGAAPAIPRLAPHAVPPSPQGLQVPRWDVFAAEPYMNRGAVVGTIVGLVAGEIATRGQHGPPRLLDVAGYTVGGFLSGILVGAIVYSVRAAR